jgi:hypothetical protein
MDSVHREENLLEEVHAVFAVVLFGFRHLSKTCLTCHREGKKTKRYSMGEGGGSQIILQQNKHGYVFPLSLWCTFYNS